MINTYIKIRLHRFYWKILRLKLLSYYGILVYEFSMIPLYFIRLIYFNISPNVPIPIDN